ncbi:MAG TPA: hypothetical protein VK506_05070 [Conexibacter sp.]|nr:hypothetical protein [Conexibacter sp.]
MTSESAPAVHEQGSRAFALCDAAALAARAQGLLAGLRSHLDAFAHDGGPTRQLDAAELERLRAESEEIAELAAQVALAIDGLPLDAFTVDEREVAIAARVALAEGIVDDRRACTAASLLMADEGLPALADALVCSDAHVYWDARVVDVLAAFRDVDQHRARHVAALAGVPETARFSELRPARVLELAQVARRHVAS